MSVVVPAFNEERNLAQLYQQVCSTLDSARCPFELIFVDDGSADRTLSVIKELRRQDSRVQFLSFSRNFGHQAALLAGMSRVRGEVVITMDCDLQHPPELLPRMLELWQQGYEVVHTVKRSDISAGVVRRLTSRIFYRCFSRLSGLSIEFGRADFRLLDAPVAHELCRLPEHHKFLRGLVSWMGFRETSIEYDVAPRLNGRSGYTIGRRLQFHIDAILSFSIVPLRVFSILGLLACASAALYGFTALVTGLYAWTFGYPVWVERGWASLMVLLAFLGGVQLLGIGMLGEYLGRVFEQAKGRPPYVIREASTRIPDPARQLPDVPAMAVDPRHIERPHAVDI